ARVLGRGDLAAPERGASAVQLAAGTAGDVVAVWLERRGDDVLAVAATRPAGGAWAASQPPSAPGQDAAALPLARHPPADALATWQRSDGANVVIQASFRPAGGTWSAATTLSAAGQDAYHARAALDDRGDALVVWGRSDGSHTIVQAAELPPGGAWSVPVD